MAAGLVLLLFGAVTALFSLQLPIGTLRGPGSGLFFLAVGLILMGLAACHLVELHLAGSKPTTDTEAHRDDGSAWRVLLCMGVMVLGTAFFTILGFPLVAFLLMAGLLYFLGLQRKGMQVVIPDAESFRGKAKPAVEALFQKEWSVTTWAEVLGQ